MQRPKRPGDTHCMNTLDYTSVVTSCNKLEVALFVVWTDLSIYFPLHIYYM